MSGKISKCNVSRIDRGDQDLTDNPENMEALLFLFGESKHEHRKFSKSCPGCRWNYPSACDILGCNGFIHIEYLDDPYLPFVFLCDVCDFKVITK